MADLFGRTQARMSGPWHLLEVCVCGLLLAAASGPSQRGAASRRNKPDEWNYCAAVWVSVGVGGFFCHPPHPPWALPALHQNLTTSPRYTHTLRDAAVTERIGAAHNYNECAAARASRYKPAEEGKNCKWQKIESRGSKMCAISTRFFPGKAAFQEQLLHVCDATVTLAKTLPFLMPFYISSSHVLHGETELLPAAVWRWFTFVFLFFSINCSFAHILACRSSVCSV